MATEPCLLSRGEGDSYCIETKVHQKELRLSSAIFNNNVCLPNYSSPSRGVQFETGPDTVSESSGSSVTA